MGLDMYLRAEKYVSGYTEPETVKAVAKIMEVNNLVTEDVSASVGFTIGYWRKANAIHNWFVGTNEDDCRPIYVPRTALVELLSTCSQLIAACNNPEVDATDMAQELLPTTEGFFFGPTDYDEWYWETIENTIKIIETALDNTDDSWSFEYQASW